MKTVNGSEIQLPLPIFFFFKKAINMETLIVYTKTQITRNYIGSVYVCYVSL